MTRTPPRPRTERSLVDTTIDPYPTRKVSTPRTMQRVEPVVRGSAGDGPLTQAQLDHFDRDGLLQLDDVFSADEVTAMLDELHRMSDDAELRAEDGIIADPETGDIRSIFDVQHRSPLLDRVIRDERIAGAARQILGTEVYLHQTRVNDKPGFGGSGFNWHSDFETWHAEDGMPTPHCLSASILLTDNHSQNGPLLLIPGSHRTFIACVGATPQGNWLESLKQQEAGVPEPALIREQYEAHGLHVGTASAGSVILFDSNTLHASNANITPDRRSNVFAVFNSVDNALQAPYEAPQVRPNFLGNRTVEPLRLAEATGSTAAA